MDGANPTISGTSTGTLNLFNTNLTSVNAYGAATGIVFGATTGVATVRNVTFSLPNATTLSMDGVNPTISGTSTGTLTLFNTNLTKVNAFQASTDNVLFATTGVTTVRNNLSVTGTLNAGNFATAGIATFSGSANNINQTAGTAQLNRLNVTGVSTVTDLTITGTLTQDGSSTVSGTQNVNNLNVTGVTTTKNLIVNGDLTVNGTTTTLNSVTLNVDDKNIELGSVAAVTGLTTTSITSGSNIVRVASTVGLLPGQALTKTSGTGAFGATPVVATVPSLTQFTVSVNHATTGTITFNAGGPTDTTANGGGFTILGATDKSFVYNSTLLSFDSTENINVAVDKGFAVNGNLILDELQLSITNAEILGFATITDIVATNIVATTSTIDSIEGDNLNYTTGTISTLNGATANFSGQSYFVALEGTDLNVSGISTLYDLGTNTLSANRIYCVGVTTITELYTTKLTGFDSYFTGVTTANNLRTNAGIVTDLNVKYFTLTNSITDIVTQANTIIGITTDRIGITTTNIEVGDVIVSSGSELSITSETTVINIFNGIIEITPISLNVAETTTSTIRVYRDPRAGIASVSTLKANVGIVTNLTVSSSTVGASTVTDRLDVGNSIYSSGIASIATLRVNSGITSYFSGTNITFSGIGTISQQLYTNVGFVTFLSGTNVAYSGIGTIDTLRTNVGVVTHLTGTNVSYSGIGTIDTLRTNTGIITNLSGTDVSYSGFGTFGSTRANTGFVTTISGTRATYQDIDNTNLYNTGIASFTNLRTNIGIVTFLTGTNLNYSGIGTINDLRSSLINSGVGTIGSLYATDAVISGNTSLVDASITRAGIVNAEINDISITGIASITNLQVTNVAITSAVGDELAITTLVANNLISDRIYSSGITSVADLFVNVGFTTFFNATNASVGLGTVTVLNNSYLYTTGVGTINELRTNVGFVTFLSGTNLWYTGVSTLPTLYTNVGLVTYLTGTNAAYSGIGTIDTLRTNVGFVTFLSGTNLVYSGVTTLSTVNADTLQLNTITNTDTFRTNIGFATYQSGTNLDYTGIGTIDTFKSNVGLVTFLTGTNLYYSGIGSVNSLYSNVGVSTYHTSTNSYTTGIGTIISFYANVGVVTTLSGTRATYENIDVTRLFATGISTITNLITNSGIVTYLSGTNSIYSGISTVGFLSATNVNISGITTINTQLISPNNSLTYLNDGINLDYTGIGSIRTLRTNTGFVTSISGTNLYYPGIGTIGTIQNVDFNNTGTANINKLNVADGSITVGIATFDQIITDSIQTVSLDLSGAGLVYTGVATFFKLNVVESSDIPYLTNNNFRSSGISTFNFVNAININAVSGVSTVGKLRVGAGGTILSADAQSGIGSVGINTASPRNALHVYGSLQINDNTVHGTVSIALTEAVSTAVHQAFSREQFRSVEYTVQASIGNTHQITKIMTIHDGVTAYNSEYSNISTGVDVANYDVDIDNSIPPGYIRLNVTPVSNVGITTVIVSFTGYKI